MATIISFISGKPLDPKDSVQATQIRDALLNYIREQYPGFSDKDFISSAELLKLRQKYLLHLISMEDADVNQAENEVVDAITNNKILSENIEPIIDEKLSFGQRSADKIAFFGGSWKFIIFFGLFITFWILLNVLILRKHPFDPYPFILLNLMLSCLAAIQAPIIMMSQNRLEQKDRFRGENDYKVNLKAELEIKLLHEKLDHISLHQNKILFEIQQMQMDYLQEILKNVRNTPDDDDDQEEEDMGNENPIAGNTDEKTT